MPITDTEALVRTIEHREIFHDEMLALMRRIMGGQMSAPMMAALLLPDPSIAAFPAIAAVWLTCGVCALRRA